MIVEVSVNTSALTDMQITQQQLEASIRENLDNGLDVEDEGRVYLADFSVIVTVTD